MYQVKFKSSGIVAFSSTERAVAAHWFHLNNFGPDEPVYDPDTGEIEGWSKGEHLDLFKLVKASTNKE